MDEKSIHDNDVVSYSVLCRERKLVIQTEIIIGAVLERTDVVFRGLEAYALDGDNLDTVLFSIDRVEVDRLVDEEQQRFSDGVNYGWPGSWNTSIEDSKECLKNRNCVAWRIQSSIGMEGFVVAQSMEFKAHS